MSYLPVGLGANRILGGHSNTSFPINGNCFKIFSSSVAVVPSVVPSVVDCNPLVDTGVVLHRCWRRWLNLDGTDEWRTVVVKERLIVNADATDCTILLRLLVWMTRLRSAIDAMESFIRYFGVTRCSKFKHLIRMFVDWYWCGFVATTFCWFWMSARVCLLFVDWLIDWLIIYIYG